MINDSIKRYRKERDDAMIAENFGPTPEDRARYEDIVKDIPGESMATRGVRKLGKGVVKVLRTAKKVVKKGQKAGEAIIKRYTK